LALDFKLYLITDRKQARFPLSEAVRMALQGGVRAVQLREKDLPVRDFLALARDIRKITNEFGAKLFINDRVDIAVAIDADGVHLGHESMPPEAVRKVVGARMLIGVSTHSLEEARAAEAGGADLITFGPVFTTASKLQYGRPVGIDALKKAAQEVKVPVFGLGGIKRENIHEVMSAGADGIAMISAVFAADDIQRAALDVLGLVHTVRTQQGHMRGGS
jgi:thiamine-phosphate pyrophosphorylase